MTHKSIPHKQKNNTSGPLTKAIHNKSRMLGWLPKAFRKKHISMKWVTAWKIIRNPIKSCFRFSIQLQTNNQSWKSFKATKGVKSYVTMVICTWRSPQVLGLSGGMRDDGDRTNNLCESLKLPYTLVIDKIVSKIFFDSNKVFVLSFHTEKNCRKHVNNEGEPTDLTFSTGNNVCVFVEVFYAFST